MSNIINATPDDDGRIVLELYGKKIEIDDTMFDEEGVATIKQFGQVYEVHKPIEKKKQSRKKSAKKEAEEETQSQYEEEKIELASEKSTNEEES